MRFIHLALLMVCCATGGQAADVRHATATRDGVRIEYTDRGAGPAILMVASLGRSGSDFNEIADGVAAAGFRVICPEPRGVGGSTGPMEGLTLHDLAADLAAVVEQSGAAPVVALGHAYGNTPARTFATDRPDLVRGVILVAASGRAPMSDSVQRAIAKSSDLTLPRDERLKHLAEAYFAPGHDASSWLDGWHPATQAAEFAAFRRTPASEYVPAGGKMPILDIQADHDVIIPPQYSLDLKNELGDRVSVVVIHDAGHALVPEQPAELVTAITNWMQRFR